MFSRRCFTNCDFYLYHKLMMDEAYLILIVIINFCCVYCGRVLTEHKNIALPVLFPKLDRKPFNCRPCLTFHLLWMVNTVCAFIFESFVLFVFGVVFSWVVFGVLHYSSKSKIDS